MMMILKVCCFFRVRPSIHSIARHEVLFTSKLISHQSPRPPPPPPVLCCALLCNAMNVQYTVKQQNESNVLRELYF